MSFTPRQPGSYVASRAKGDNRVTPRLRDVAFNRHSYNDGRHISPLDNGKVVVGEDGINVVLVQGINEDDFKQVMSMTTRATIGVDLTDPAGMEDNRDWEEMLQGGLQTALESQVLVFAVSGASRTATHQIVRTRKAAFHQSSQRASFLGAQPEMRIPESIWNAPPHVVEIWLKSVYLAHQAYREACDADVSYQDARFILPEGTTNFITMEYPLREFLNVYAYRACYMFQWEINSIMHACGEILTGKYPWLEPYVKISCEKTNGALDIKPDANLAADFDREQIAHHCTFQGWEQVEGQCPLAWARESNRSFRSKHHEIGRGK